MIKNLDELAFSQFIELVLPSHCNYTCDLSSYLPSCVTFYQVDGVSVRVTCQN